jgi:hypothetical protein
MLRLNSICIESITCKETETQFNSVYFLNWHTNQLIAENGSTTNGHVREGYLKIQISVDVKKKRILPLEVTSEVHDGKLLKLVDNAYENNNLN